METEQKIIKCEECAYNIGIDKVICAASIEPIEITSIDGCSHGLNNIYTL